jgi:hexosaminidase
LKDEEALQGYFTTRIAKFLESKGRRLQGWNEIMNGTDLPKDVVVQQWSAPASAEQAAKLGLDVVCSPTRFCYFDYPYRRISTRRVLSFEPVPVALEGELAAHILGPQGNVWTEHLPGPADVDRMTFPRVYALAEVGWSAKGDKAWENFVERVRSYVATQPEADRAGLIERTLAEAQPATRNTTRP